MKTHALGLRTVLLAASLAWVAACSSGKEVSRGDARVRGPQEGSSSATGGTAGKPADPNAPPPRERMPDINARAKLLFEDAVKSFEQQKKARKLDHAGLIRKFQTALDADGQLAEAAYNMGVISERQGNREGAIKYYKDALRRKPTLKEAAENLAVLAQNTGDTQTAQGIYQDILRVYPDDASSRARMAELYRQSGDSERALEYAREALIRDPKVVPAYKVMMKSYLDRKQLALAKLVALRAVKLDESDPELYHTTGLILIQENEPVKARLQFKKALEVRPDFQPSHVVLAKLSLQDGDYAGAEQHLRSILQQDGKNAEVHLNLGIAYRGMGQFDKALAEYDIAEKLNPDLPGIYLGRGVVLHKGKGSPERGLELYKKYMSMAGEGIGDSQVGKLIQDAEQELSKVAEMKAAEEQAKQMEQQQKEEERLKKQEEAELKKQGKGGDEPEALPSTDVAAASKEGKATAPKAEKSAAKAPAPTPAPEKKIEAPPPAPAKTVPAKGTKPKDSDEPTGEPLDDL
jgi:tetratricopeptide (TPR) repeat protein